MNTQDDQAPVRPADPPQPSPPPPQPPLPPEGLVSVSLRDGWQAFKREPAMLIVFNILKVPIALLAAAALSGGMWWGAIVAPDGVQQFQKLIWGSLLCLLDGFVSVGILYAALLTLRRRPVPFGTLFAGFTRFAPVVVGLVLFQLVVGVGLLFFILPGIVLALAFSQWALLAMDRRVDGPQALSQSWHMMRGYKAELFLLWLVLIPINLLGLAPLGLGLIVTIPYSFAVLAAFYDRLVKLNPPTA